MNNYHSNSTSSMQKHQHPLPSKAALPHHSHQLSTSQQQLHQLHQQLQPQPLPQPLPQQQQCQQSSVLHSNKSPASHNHHLQPHNVGLGVGVGGVGGGGLASMVMPVACAAQPIISNSLAIRQEIQRFESVHPSIYAIYDLIDLLPIADSQIAQQIRDHVVCIEDSFVNSQEWTISRSVPDLRLGIVGSLNSGKSALVHRYLTGSYMQEESPEGGRFKKEVFIDGQSYLLLIRDEGGAPEMQFAAWIDAVIFVFSLENEASFNTVYNYYQKMAHFRNGQDLPMILVGTQDSISERNPRVIDDSRARKLANDLKRCSYYETCATYGLNVERVFQDACQKILTQRIILPPAMNSRPTTPQGSRLNMYHNGTNGSIASKFNGSVDSNAVVSSGNLTLPHRHHVLSTSSHHIPMRISAEFTHSEQQASLAQSASQKTWLRQHQHQQQQDRDSERDPSSDKYLLAEYTNENNNIAKYSLNSQAHHAKSQIPQMSSKHQQQQQQQQQAQQQHLLQSQLQQYANNEHLIPVSLVPLREHKDNGAGGVGSNNGSGGLGSGSASNKDLPTPTSTPTTSRKSRRRSNLFIPSSSKKSDKELKNGEVGSGRSIPIKQGYLYKRSSKSLNKEWKKKYVTLCDDGRLTYHPSLHDYMDDVHGKEIPLQYVTVKVPGQKPRGSKSIITNSALTSSISNTFDTFRETVKSNSSQHTSGDEGIAMSNSNSQTFIAGNMEGQQAQHLHQQHQQQTEPRELLTVNSSTKLESQTPNVKKRHRRMKSSSVKSNELLDDCDGYEFFIVSLDSKQWHFEAANSEERDEWVVAIEREICKSLEGIESSRMKPLTSSEKASMLSIRTQVPGNDVCVDCSAPNPEWASLNLGVLMCIECSGIHRNLGSHISKVRSLGLDDWPYSHLAVMLAIGNSLANSVWEANCQGRPKPKPNSTHEEKEEWIRSKYEAKDFMAKSNAHSNVPIGQQLIEAVIRADMKSIVLILATSSSEVTNASVSPRDVRTPLLLACAIGNLAIAQLLIWNGANISHADHEGRTCLAYAKAAQSLATSKSHKAALANANANSSSTSSSNVNNLTSSSSASNASNSTSSSSNLNTASTASAGPSATSTATFTVPSKQHQSSSSSSATNTTNASTSASNSNSNNASLANSIPAPQYNVEETTALVELLINLGCSDSAPTLPNGTLSRRRDNSATP